MLLKRQGEQQLELPDCPNILNDDILNSFMYFRISQHLKYQVNTLLSTD